MKFGFDYVNLHSIQICQVSKRSDTVLVEKVLSQSLIVSSDAKLLCIIDRKARILPLLSLSKHVSCN